MFALYETVRRIHVLQMILSPINLLTVVALLVCQHIESSGNREPVRSSYLIVVLAHKLPVVLAMSLPRSMVDILVNIEIRESFLFVHPAIQLLPWYGKFGRVEVDPYEAEFINMGMNVE